jgi:hypothetical protein
MKDVFQETDLVMPGLVSPSNLKRGGRFKTAPITSDIYSVCERLKELSPRLSLHWVEDSNPKARDQIAFVVTETYLNENGQPEEAVVWKSRKLTPEIVERCRYYMNVPMEKRYAAMVAEAEKIDAEREENEFQELYENLGRPMWTQLEHDGFVETRGVSYPKTGVAKPGAVR